MVENVEELIKAHEGLKREVYLDIENSSPVPQEVIEAMLPYFTTRGYGNPALTHKPGWEAYEAIMKSAQKIARYIGAENPEEITFTPGETEANNLALLGTALTWKNMGKKICISEIEPVSVLHIAQLLQEKFGYKTVKIPVDKEGLINLEKLKEVVDKETVLVSIAAVNPEIGTIQPIKEAAEIVKTQNPNTVFHTDFSDGYGKIKINLSGTKIDLATLSSYKILGPRGMGALYIREKTKIEKILEGQIATQKFWPGIENTPLIVGFAKASELAFENFEEKVAHLRRLRDKLIEGLLSQIQDTLLNGPHGENRAPDNVNISFLHCEGEALTIELSLKGVYVSSGSACTRRLLQPSHILVAIGRRFEEAHGSILMKVTRLHTDEDIEYVLEVFPEAVQRIRKIVGSTVSV
jgi:cysteine desulfurase